MTEPGWPGLEELAPKAALTPATWVGSPTRACDSCACEKDQECGCR
jgi:hypothetical protein